MSDADTAAAVDRYDRIASVFTTRVAEVADWAAPAPCEGWTVRDVVGHVVGWVPGFMGHFAGVTVPAMPGTDDPVTAWSTLDSALRGWLNDPAIRESEVGGPMGQTTVAGLIDQFVTTDVLIHTWDLARGAGLDDRLDSAEIAGMREGMEPMDAMLRESGHYGPRVEVAESADEQDRLLGFLGRDPNWVGFPSAVERKSPQIGG